jgi:hypothetical protein
MTDTWINLYWNSEIKQLLNSALSEFEASKNEIIESVIAACKPLLPSDVDLNIGIEIHIIADGNRAGIQFDNKIIMEAFLLLGLPSLGLPSFIHLLKHEVHHAYYGKWFAKKTANRERNKSERLLYKYQETFISEGIAQRLDFDGFSPEDKQMFANKELIIELFDEWISLMRELTGDSPQTAHLKYQENHYKNAVERKRKYYPGEMTNEANRPTVEYYLSYNIYNSIFESGGQEKLMYVIENPDKLLLVYNELHTDSMLVPRIPDDIVTLWKNNL